MKTALLNLGIGVALSLSSLAQATPIAKLFCQNANPPVSVYMNIDTEEGKSFGRMSNPWTADHQILKSDNLNKRDYTPLYIGLVEPMKGGYSLQADRSPITPNPMGILKEAYDLSMSTLKIEGDKVTFKMFISADRYATMPCEVL